MDFLTSNGIKPVVELSFMPSAFVSCGGDGQPKCRYAFNDVGSYKGLIMPPDNFDDWYLLIQRLTAHLVERYAHSSTPSPSLFERPAFEHSHRYGAAEVGTWYFEVWNEMWGVAFPQPYLQLYNASAAAIKSVNQSFRVGGPATMQVGRKTQPCLQAAQRAASCSRQRTACHPPRPASGQPASRTHPAAVRGAREAADAIH